MSQIESKLTHPALDTLAFHYEAPSQSSAYPPLVILHGLLGSRQNWRMMQKQLASAGYESYALDMRNHGSSFHANSHSYGDLAKDVRDWLATQNFPRFHLLGHSMGGKAAMVLALHADQAMANRLASLCVVDIAPLSYRVSHHGHLFSLLQSLKLADYPQRKAYQQALVENGIDHGMASFVSQNLVTNDQGLVTGWRINLPVLAASLRQLEEFPSGLSRNYWLDGPIHFIKGERSDYIDEDGATALKSLFPQAQIHEMAGVGHWPHSEAPSDFMRLVLSLWAT